MIVGAAYCGAPALPGTLWGRFNVDPVLIVILATVAVLHVRENRRAGRPAAPAALGWAVAAGAFLSPLCALSTSLFSARVAQHMILLLVAAPMIALALPDWRALHRPGMVWSASVSFFLALWFWHMPGPYEATFPSVVIYWLMHLSLFGSGIWLWSVLLRQHNPQALAAGMFASIHMGLLGAVIALATWPMYRPHYTTTEVWGFTPLADQQLGGVIMWVPGCLLFVWVALRSLAAIWRTLEDVPA